MDQQYSIEQDHHDHHGRNDQVVKEKTRQQCVLYSLKKKQFLSTLSLSNCPSIKTKNKLSISSHIRPVFIIVSWCVV